MRCGYLSASLGEFLRDQYRKRLEWPVHIEGLEIDCMPKLIARRPLNVSCGQR